MVYYASLGKLGFRRVPGESTFADTKTGETEDDRKESEDEAEYKWSGYRLRQFNFSPLDRQSSLIHLAALRCDQKTKGKEK